MSPVRGLWKRLWKRVRPCRYLAIDRATMSTALFSLSLGGRGAREPPLGRRAWAAAAGRGRGLGEAAGRQILHHRPYTPTYHTIMRLAAGWHAPQSEARPIMALYPVLAGVTECFTPPRAVARPLRTTDRRALARARRCGGRSEFHVSTYPLWVLADFGVAWSRACGHCDSRDVRGIEPCGPSTGRSSRDGHVARILARSWHLRKQA